MSLKYLWEQREIPSQYAKWLVKLMGFQFTVKYREGRTNKVADALSRVNMELDAILKEISVLFLPDIEAICQEVCYTPIEQEVERSLLFKAVQEGSCNRIIRG